MKRNKMQSFYLMKELKARVFREFVITSFSVLGLKTIMISLLDHSHLVGHNLNLKILRYFELKFFYIKFIKCGNKKQTTSALLSLRNTPNLLISLKMLAFIYLFIYNRINTLFLSKLIFFYISLLSCTVILQLVLFKTCEIHLPNLRNNRNCVNYCKTVFIVYLNLSIIFFFELLNQI
jgi:hypothetical protein